MELNDVLQEVSSRTFPSESECSDTLEKAEALLEEVRSAINSTENADGVTPILVGSVAKLTFLKQPDIDIFIRFPAGTDFDTIESKGLEIARKVLS